MSSFVMPRERRKRNVRRETKQFQSFFSSLTPADKEAKTLAEVSAMLRRKEESTGEVLTGQFYVLNSVRKTESLRRKWLSTLAKDEEFDVTCEKQINHLLNTLLAQQTLLEREGKISAMMTYNSWYSNIKCCIIRLYRLHFNDVHCLLPSALWSLLSKYQATMHRLLPVSQESIEVDAEMIGLALRAYPNGSRK